MACGHGSCCSRWEPVRHRGVPALHAGLSSLGVDVDELLLWEGVPPLFDVRDPDGNTLDFSQSRRPEG